MILVSGWEPNTDQAELVPYAVLALVGYGLGVPSTIGVVMWKYKSAMQRDQSLWLAGRGGDAMNRDFRVRRRYAKLYQDYRLGYHWWRLVLLGASLVRVVCDAAGYV